MENYLAISTSTLLLSDVPNANSAAGKLSYVCQYPPLFPCPAGFHYFDNALGSEDAPSCVQVMSTPSTYTAAASACAAASGAHLVTIAGDVTADYPASLARVAAAKAVAAPSGFWTGSNQSTVQNPFNHQYGYLWWDGTAYNSNFPYVQGYRGSRARAISAVIFPLPCLWADPCGTRTAHRGS